MAAKKKGIFCLEGAWWGVKDKTSVEPMLRLLEAMGDYEVPYFHHDVATHEEFDFYLKKWRGRSLAEVGRTRFAGARVPAGSVIYETRHAEVSAAAHGKRTRSPEGSEISDVAGGGLTPDAWRSSPYQAPHTPLRSSPWMQRWEVKPRAA